VVVLFDTMLFCSEGWINKVKLPKIQLRTVAVCMVVWSVVFCPLSAAESKKIPETATFWSDYPVDELADFLVDHLNNEELLSQILMFGWAGSEPSDLLNQWVAQRGLGSVKVFGWNTDDTKLVADSVASLQKKAAGRRFQIPLFVATDQEGGWIRHVKGDTSDTPGNMAIGASSYPVDAYYSGYYICREIKALGINMNFAPTVDLYTNKKSTIIGPRSFGEDPVHAGVLGAAFAAGSIAAGVIPTAKHFPGHGDTSIDSHGNLPVIMIDYQTLDSRELVPFKYLISEHIPAIMSGHLSYPRIVANGEPASLSKTFLTDILRKKLQYTGLIITDDMMMNGATMYAGSLSNAFKLAIQAGNDILISSTTAHLDEALWTNNLALMRQSAEFRETVKTAARRVIAAKLTYFRDSRHAPLYPDKAKIAESIPDREGQKFFLSQACRSITVYKNGTVPYKPAAEERILLAGQFPAFFTEGKKRYPQSAQFKFNYEMGPNETDWMSNNIEITARGYSTIIFCVANDRSAQVAARLARSGKKVIILSVLSPVPVLNYTWADTILLGYSYSPYTFQALFGALAGDFKPEGKLPL
jgi:beta-N-acetylhexosaminidase